MDATQMVEHGVVGVGASSPTDLAAAVVPATPTPQRAPLLATNAFAATLVVATVSLFFGGPLAGAPPLRVLIPQPEMFAVLCVLWAAASLAPVTLHYRGNSYDYVLVAPPMLLGLVFLSPAVLILSIACAEAFVRAHVGVARPGTVRFCEK